MVHDHYQIQEAFQELENWKLNFQQFISIKEKELAKKDEEVQDFVQVREAVRHYVKSTNFPFDNLSAEPPPTKKRSETLDAADSLYLAMRLQERADDLSSQIQDLEKRKKKVEAFINEAELVIFSFP